MSNEFEWTGDFRFFLGAKVAQHSCKHLHNRIASLPEFSTSIDLQEKKLSRFVFAGQGNIEAAIRKGYIEFDREMSLDEDIREDLAGTTAICVIIKDQKLFCVNEDVFPYLLSEKKELSLYSCRAMWVIVEP